MKTIAKRYYHIVGTPTAEEGGINTRYNYIKAEVYYDEGGYSYFTYRNTTRGYYMSAVDVGRGNGFESITMFNDKARKMLIEEVSRQSKKREAEALEYFEANIEEFVKNTYYDTEIDLNYEEG